MVRRAPREVRDLFGDRLLVAGAHPDDVELMAGGLLSQWSGPRKAVGTAAARRPFRQSAAIRRSSRSMARASSVRGNPILQEYPESAASGNATRSTFRRIASRSSPRKTAAFPASVPLVKTCAAATVSLGMGILGIYLARFRA